jgi:hypothetical protein
MHLFLFVDLWGTISKWQRKNFSLKQVDFILPSQAGIDAVLKHA